MTLTPKYPVDMRPEVAETFAKYPEAIRRKALIVRQLIFDTAAGIEGVGPIEEALRWGEPAYLTSTTKSGSTIRLGWKPSAPDRYALYFHCKTTLVDTFRAMFDDELTFEGNRAITLDVGDKLPTAELATCIGLALTYHRRKQSA